MKFINGFPMFTNCDDGSDSPIVSGWLALLDHPQAIDMREYYKVKDAAYDRDDIYYSTYPVRYPKGESRLETNHRCFSGDQLVMLLAGEWKQYGTTLYAPKKYWAPNDIDEVTGNKKRPDFIQPNAYNHQLLCHGLKGKQLGFKYLEWANTFQGKFNVMGETNQLLAMNIVATEVTKKNYVQDYVRKNPFWIYPLTYYYNDQSVMWLEREKAFVKNYDRGEPDLLKLIIDKVKGYL